jgi:hypothetical protein
MKMPELLTQNGFKIIEIKPIVRVAHTNTSLWTWEEIFFRNFSSKLVDAGHITKEEEKQFWIDWESLSKNPNAFYITPLLLDIIAEKA